MVLFVSMLLGPYKKTLDKHLSQKANGRARSGQHDSRGLLLPCLSLSPEHVISRWISKGATRFWYTRSESYTDRKGTEALEHVERKACPEKTNLSGKAFSELEKSVLSTTETRALWRANCWLWTVGLMDSVCTSQKCGCLLSFFGAFLRSNVFSFALSLIAMESSGSLPALFSAILSIHTWCPDPGLASTPFTEVHD